MNWIIETEDLGKRYGDVTAVQGLSGQTLQRLGLALQVVRVHLTLFQALRSLMQGAVGAVQTQLVVQVVQGVVVQVLAVVTELQERLTQEGVVVVALQPRVMVVQVVQAS